MLSSPTNSKEPSLQSALKTLTVPLGRGIPKPLAFVFWNSTLLPALRLFEEVPPDETKIRLYFLTATPYTLGMNSTCFCELSFKETGSLRVYMWKSENDFSEKEGPLPAVSAIALADLYIIIGVLCDTVLTSPAINFNFASLYLFPLLLSIETHPPISEAFYFSLRVTEQSAFHENPVVRQATSQSVVKDLLLNTFQLSVGTVKNPQGREGRRIPSILFSTSMPSLVLRMQPSACPSNVPLILKLVSPSLVQISTSLFIYFQRRENVLMRFFSQFCSNTLTDSADFIALNVTVYGYMFELTSVKQRSLLPQSKEMERISLTIANQSLYIVTARETGATIDDEMVVKVRVATSNSVTIFIYQNILQIQSKFESSALNKTLSQHNSKQCKSLILRIISFCST